MPSPELLEILLPSAVELALTFCYVIAPVVLVGTPLIMATVTTSARLGIEVVKPDELTERQSRAFGEIDALLLPQGFAPSLLATATELPNRNLMRVYTSSGDPAVAMAGVVTHEGDSGTISNQWFELETRFDDGSIVQTRNADHQKVQAVMPHVEMHEHPSVKNPLALKLKHDEHCAPRRGTGARFVRSEELVDLIEQDNIEQMAYQVEAGRYVKKKDGRFRLSFTNALRLTFGFINPIADPRLGAKLASLFSIIVLPLTTVVLLLSPSVGLPELIMIRLPQIGPEGSLFLALAPLLALGAVALGCALGPKAVIWSIFIPIVVGKMLLPHGVPGYGGQLATLALILGSVQIANGTSHFLNTRRDITAG